MFVCMYVCMCVGVCVCACVLCVCVRICVYFMHVFVCFVRDYVRACDCFVSTNTYVKIHTNSR